MAKADPARLSQARVKLAGLRGAPPIDGFQTKLVEAASTGRTRPISAPDLIADVMAHADRNRMAAATARLNGAETGDATAKAIAREKVLKQFESTLLASTLESIMPKSQDRLISSGPAEEIWRGQQVQFMAEAIAERSPLGLRGLFGDDLPQALQVAAVPTANLARIKPFAFGAAEEG